MQVPDQIQTPCDRGSITLDVEFVRGKFPNIEDFAFFENAGGTLVPSVVSELVYDYMRRNQVQPGAPYPASAEAHERIDRSHRKLAEMIGARPKEVIVGHSTTVNVSILASAMRSLIRPGDEIIVTNLDHEANSGAWRRLAEFGAVIKEWRIDPKTGELGGAARLNSLLSDRVRLVCCTWCSNITGSINDIAEIADAAHSVGAWICVDAVAYAPHRALDLAAADIDLCLFSLYKLYGPHLGVLYGKSEVLRQLPGQNHYFFSDNALPFKMQPGGYLHETAASIEGICSYFKTVHAHHFDESQRSLAQRYAEVFELIAAHEQKISQPLLDYLCSRKEVRIIGFADANPKLRVPTISFVVRGRKSAVFPKMLGRRGFGISSGHFYAKRSIDALQLGRFGGVVRISMVHYNSAGEVSRLIEQLDAALLTSGR